MNQDYCFNYTFVGNRQKPIILFLHGFLGDRQDFSAVIDLISSDFCCLLLDLPGHGHTIVQQDCNYLLPNIAKAIVELLTCLQIRQCFLVGYSLGGRIALYLGIYFPQCFLGVVLESASPGLKTKLERDRRILQDFELAKQLESQELAIFIKQWYNQPLFDSFRQHPSFFQASLKRLNNDPFKLAKCLRYSGLGMQPSIWQQLSSNYIPLLLIVGELDLKFVAINQEIANICSQVSLQIVKNTGHNIHFENPQIYAQLLYKFFNLQQH